MNNSLHEVEAEKKSEEFCCSAVSDWLQKDFSQMPHASAAHIKCRHLAVITGGSDQIQCLGRTPPHPPGVVILQLEA